MGAAQMWLVGILALCFVISYIRSRFFSAFAFLVLAFLAANTIVRADVRPRLTMAVVIDTDITQNDPTGDYAMIEVKRALDLLGSQAKLDVIVSARHVGEHIADHTNPTALTDAVSAFHARQAQRLGVTLFLTKRALGVGSKRYRGFTNLYGAYVTGGVVVQMVYDGFDYQTIAHELGHALGAPHDDAGMCKGASPAAGWLMQEYLSGSEYFSDCSLAEIAFFIGAHKAEFYPQPAPVQATTATPATGGGGSLSWWFCAALGALVIAQHYRVRRWKREAAKQARSADGRAVALNRLRAEHKLLRADLERLRYKLGVEVGIGVREHIDANARGVYECGEGYAHPIGQACTGQCVLRG
jgi:hypothetical protein